MNNCSICLEEINSDDTISLECTHTFHNSCIEEWAKVSGKPKNDNFEWVCPLCRFTISDTLEESDSLNEVNIRDLTLVKFKRDRTFVQFITFTDFMFSFLLILGDNPFNIVYCVCSLYGYYGATHLNVGYLTSYSVFCGISFLLRFLSVINYFYVHNYRTNDMIINNSEMNSSFYLLFFFLTTFLQLYLMTVVTRMCTQIKQYDQQIRYMIA